MPTYEVLVPCAYIHGGRLVRHRRPGAVVELGEDVAAGLGPKVKPLVPKRRPREPKTSPLKPVSPPSPPPSSGGGTAPPNTVNPIEDLLDEAAEIESELEMNSDGE